MQAEALFYPKNLVIVGATERVGNWSGHVYESLHLSSYPGQILPVNPRYETVWGLPCYPTLADLPVPPDQVLVLVPADLVVGVITEAAALGARSAVIYGSGFGEDPSPAGQARGEALQAIIRETGIAVEGPNCLGYASYPGQAITLTNGASDRKIEDGSIAVVAQSGGVALALNDATLLRRLKPRYMVSSGNETGLTLEDYLDFYVEDDGVKVIGAFIETVKDADRFLEIVSKAGKLGKPIVACKMGGSEGSRRAAIAHTGRLAGSRRVFVEVAEARGVIVVNTIDEMIDILCVLSSGRVPPSRRVGAITVSGGLKGIFLDTADRWDLEMPALSPGTVESASKLMGVGTSVGNPLDTGFTGLSDTQALYNLMSLVAEDPLIDNLIIQQLRVEGDDQGIVDTYEAATRAASKVDGVTMMTGGFMTLAPSGEAFERFASFPNIVFAHSAERGIVALSRVARYAETIKEINEGPQGADEDSSKRTPFPAGDRLNELMEDELAAKAALRQYGLLSPGYEIFPLTGDTDPIKAATNLHWPVIVKAVASGVTHKSELGFVSSLVWTEPQLREEYDRVASNVHKSDIDPSGVTMCIEEGVMGGIECVMGYTWDEEMGDLLMFGSGGIGVELFGDVAFARANATTTELTRMIKRTRIGQLLAGQRGRLYDLPALLSALRGLQNFAADFSENLAAIEINPLLVLPEGKGVFMLDAAIIPSTPDDAAHS